MRGICYRNSRMKLQQRGPRQTIGEFLLEKKLCLSTHKTSMRNTDYTQYTSVAMEFFISQISISVTRTFSFSCCFNVPYHLLEFQCLYSYKSKIRLGNVWIKNE